MNAMSLADLLARLPSPIALPLHDYLEKTDPHLKLWAMSDTVELLLRLLVFIGIADLAREDGKPPQALRKALREHAAYEALEPLGDTVLTGNTGTNLCDLNVLYIGTQE